MPDPSRLIAYAEQHGCRWRASTEPRGEKWEATAQLIPGPMDPKPIFSSGLCDSEQGALDRAIELAIDHDRWRRRPMGKSAWEYRAGD